MGKLDTSMGFSVNEDGSITRIGCATRQLSTTPDFIPASLSKLKGGFWKKVLYILYFILVLGVHGAIVGLSVGLVAYNGDIEHYYKQYEERRIAFQNKDLTNEDYRRYSNEDSSWYHDSWLTPDESYERYESYKTQRLIIEISLVISVILAIYLDIVVISRLIKNYPNKKHILKGVDYVQADLGFNYGYPYIMTNNQIGVLNTHKKKVIVQPRYEHIYWIIPQNVLCAVVRDKKDFFDINGKALTNVPSSYYNTKTSF